MDGRSLPLSILNLAFLLVRAELENATSMSRALVELFELRV